MAPRTSTSGDMTSKTPRMDINWPHHLSLKGVVCIKRGNMMGHDETQSNHGYTNHDYQTMVITTKSPYIYTFIPHSKCSHLLSKPKPHHKHYSPPPSSSVRLAKNALPSFKRETRLHMANNPNSSKTTSDLDAWMLNYIANPPPDDSTPTDEFGNDMSNPSSPESVDSEACVPRIVHERQMLAALEDMIEMNQKVRKAEEELEKERKLRQELQAKLDATKATSGRNNDGAGSSRPNQDPKRRRPSGRRNM